MNNFLAKFSVVLSVLMALVMSPETVNASDSGAKKTINIGIYAPFSNESALIGRNMLGALEIARDQLKSTEINYEFYTLDMLPENTSTAGTLQKFIDAHHINVILTDGAASGAVVAPLAEKNNLIHFCLTDDSVITDGKNNFQAKSSNHRHGAALATTEKPEFIAQFQEEYFSQPVIEAGYVYDIFHLLNSSAVIAMKTNTNFSSQAIASNLLALESRAGLMGAFSLDKKGVSYKKEILTA